MSSNGAVGNTLLAHQRGPTSYEATAFLGVHGDNDDFLGGGTLEQAPVYTLQLHVNHTLPTSHWFSASVAYSMGGETTANGRDTHDPRDTLYYGISAGNALTAWLGMKLAYVGSTRQVPTGSDSDSVALTISTVW